MRERPVADAPDVLRAPTPRTRSALPRRLAAPLGLAALGLLALVAHAGDVEAGSRHLGGPRLVARADTDSTAAPRVFLDDVAPGSAEAALLDSLDAAADSAGADTTDADSLARAYFRRPVRTGSGVSIAPRRLPGVRGRLGTYWRREVTLDSAAYRYRVREVVGRDDVRAPADVTLAEFLAARRQEALGEGFRELAARRADRQTRRGGGFGFAVDVPGGEQSAFRTIFGKNEVALNVNGTSNVNLGVKYDQNDFREAANGDGDSFAPAFGQELNLNVAGTIGDKLTINVNYDTQSQFDFENQVSLIYEGYEDDIIQRIEAGNVFLQTPSTLIRGGQRLFGIKTELQFGPLALTAVASQQDAETVDRVFEGGSDAQPFDLAPFRYEDNQHFFLGYAFHNWWDEGHRIPGIAQPPPGFGELIGVEVWKHEPGLISANNQDVETTWAVALADLGEPTPGTPGNDDGLNVLEGGEAYLGAFDETTGTYTNARAPLPNPARDQYSTAEIAAIRTNATTVSAETVTSDPADGATPLPNGAFSNNKFKKLKPNVDYTYDPQYGWLSLTAPLTQNEEIAVAYQYRDLATGQTITVGDYLQPAQTDSQTGARTVLKLLRASGPAPASPLWDLTLRNIYRVGGRQLNPSTFTLGITYEPPGAAESTEPRDISFEQRTFLEVLGLDRVNAQGTATADNAFDFLSGFTVDASNGRVLFPVRQPFGDYLRNLIRTGWTVSGERVNVSYGGLTPEEAADRYVPTQAGTGDGLYDLVQNQAQRTLPGLIRFAIAGEFKSASQSTFNVGFNLVEGTVRVTAEDIELVEGTDYRVNYTAGTVEIINPRYLAAGQRVRVSVEQNKFFSIGSKTLLGLRADYRLDEDFNVGATWMRLAERPLGDKFRVGEEALDNSVLGVDGSFLAEPRWLTRAIDALPLLQTRAPSRIELRGEFARLNPGHPQTFAFERARDGLRAADLDFDPDELDGISYIDDFEGSENAFTALEVVGGWRIAAAPDSAGPAGSVRGDGQSRLTDTALKTNWRGLFTWYSISETSYRRFSDAGILTAATDPVSTLDLFPERARTLESRDATRPLDLLDLYFDPTQRGPYNFNGDLAGVFAANPEDVWGGFIRPIDGAYSDFQGQNNVEFIELLLSPLGGPDGTQAVGPNARLYIDLGQLYEDVLPNGGFTNSEDGLRLGEIIDPAAELDVWGRKQSVQTNGVVDFEQDTGRTEDLGLDGLRSRATGVTEGGAPYAIDEQEHFADFLATLGGLPDAQARAIANDPAGDDYRYFLEDGYFEDPAFFPGGASVQDRYAQYLPAFEINSVVAQQRLGEGRGVSTLPNSEDINGNGRTDVAEGYHRYEIPLTDDGLRASPFFQNTLVTPNELSGGPQTWYLLRIPVRTENRTTVGLARTDFSRIEAARVWTTGHDKPATLRIASFELVGSQWLKSDEVGFVDEGRGDALGAEIPGLFIESINNEENASIYAIPRGTVQNTARSISGQIRPTREQSIVFRAETLAEGRRAAISRTYATRPLDLTKYTNLRLAVHGHGFDRTDDLRVFLRVGDNETEDYYEIEQPVYPFDPDRLDALFPEGCPAEFPSNCARSDSLWQTNVPVPGGDRVDLNPINVLLSEFNRAKLERDRNNIDPVEAYTLDETPEGAPPGARITVRGQPSIQDVRTVVLGVRNAEGGQATPLDTVTVWFNELRVTGYDEGGGASGFLTANVALADVATVNARLSFTDDGFGELGGALGGRSFASNTAFTLTSAFQAHKLLPERFGWNLPVSVTVTENTSTPRYDPDNGDIRLDELITSAEEAVAEGEDLPETLRAEAVLARAQTTTSSRNVRLAASKTGSRSPWLRYTLDGLAASYTASLQEGANPQNQLTASDTWSGNLSYRVTVPKPLTVKPLWFTQNVPVLRAIGSVPINLLPQAVTLSADARRSISASQPRLAVDFLTEPDSIRAFRALTRRTHLFEHGRQFDLRYNPLSFLQLTYASNTDQDFGAAGQRERFRILVRDPDGTFARTFAVSPSAARTDPDVLAALREAGLIGPGGGFPTSVEILGGSDLEVLPVTDALGGIFGGDGRTRNYTQRLTSQLRVSTRRLAWLKWIQPQPLSYSADYTWTDQPISTAPDLDVSSASTRSSVQSGVRIAPVEFWRLFPFYRALEARAGRGAGARGAAADSSRGFNPLSIVRGAFLAATGISDVTVTYRGSLSAGAGGLEGQAYSLLSGVTGAAPPLGFRLGLDRALDIDRRIADPNALTTFTDVRAGQHDLDGRTTLQPFRGLNVGLTARTTWGTGERVTFQIDPTGSLLEQPPNRSGNGESTVLAFGGSYEALLERHADRFRDDTGGAAEGAAVASEFLSPTGVADDFRAVWARGLGGFGPNGLFQIPLPNWSVTYSGLERLPLLKLLAQQVTLQHGYSATNRTDFTTTRLGPNARAETLLGYTFESAATIAGDGGYDEPTALLVNQRFQPLIGANVTWKGGIQTSLTYNRSNTYSLQAAAAQFSQKSIQDLRMDFSFAKTGLRLLGLRRLNNNIRLTLTAVLADDVTQDRAFRQDLLTVLTGGTPADPGERLTTRFQLSPRVSYTISNQVTADVFVRYERVYTEGTNSFPNKNFDGGVNLRILFSN